MADDTNLPILDACRDALRIAEHDFDDEIQMLIDAAEALMIESGIDRKLAENTDERLVRFCIVAFVKANFGLDNDDSEKYQKLFERLCTQLRATSDYGEVTNG